MQACNFPGATPVGKPRDWIPELDGECGTIFCIDALNEQLGLNFKYSFYKPTAKDLEVLNAGGALRLGIMCNDHPVFNMLVFGPKLVEAIELTPMWDLGEPMEGTIDVQDPDL